MSMLLVVVLSGISATLPIFGLDLESRPFNYPSQCQSNKYFDSVSLQFTDCPANQTSITGKEICSCVPGFRVVYESNGMKKKCEACPANQVTSQDGRQCVPCEVDSLYNATSKTCQSCNKSIEAVLIDRAIDGNSLGIMKCVTCSNNTSADVDLCVPCHSSLFTAGKGLCICPSNTHLLIGGICVPSSEVADIPIADSSYKVEYDNGVVVKTSIYFESYYRSSAHSCTFSENKTACQVLSNMCVLLHNSFDNELNACGFYRSRFGENYINLPDKVPWLYYPEGESESYLKKTKIKTHFSFKKNNINSKFNFTVAKYSSAGKLLQYGPLQDILKICPQIDSHLDSALVFGTTFSQSCLIDVDDIWDTFETEFFDVFLKYYDDDEENMYAIPVLNLNYRQDKSFLNRQSRSKWQLTRRFFVYDNLSGKESVSLNTGDNIDRTKVVRYIKNIEIFVQLQEGGGQENHGRIYPPLIRIEYNELEHKEYGMGKKVRTTFKLTYTMNFNKIQADLSIAVGVMSAFATLLALIQTWSWSRRSGKLTIDLLTIIHLILVECGNLANVIFAVMFFACFYWTVFFKRQDVVYMFLLTHYQEDIIKNYIIAAFILKSIQIIHIIISQISIDMFIIDWEQPRPKNSLPHPQFTVNTEENEKKNEQPISIWRTYFISNEWNELQTHRKVNMCLQLFTTLFFLKVVGFENLASADPYSNFNPDDIEYVPPQSFVCRFAICIIVYSVIVLCQWLFKTVIYERYIENKFEQFVDLCSMANISVFILEYNMFGYYMHGRSVHGYADVDMQTYYDQLKREEEDLCGHRGLEPSSECQTFEVSITYRFRDQYDSILQPVQNFASLQRQGNRRNGGSKMEESVQAHEKMKRFFSMFLQHALKDLDYIVKEKLFLEGVLDLEFQEPEEKCLFFRDNEYSFSRVLLYGQEASFVVFEMLLFTFVDMLSYDTVLASIITYIVSHFIKMIRNAGGRKNVVQKTLVDHRFLI
ncbi:unnamed protein product [Meganyctiphanes norvegica]|uniref:Meckelin n=1 Tax=Meganyctiphanes norvegica TaxID=48144 RepID=A0AAV2RZ91_MEGNR